MFVRIKPSGPRRYVQIVENRWENGQSRQRVVATLGRLDRLQATGQVDAVVKSLARFADKVSVVEALAGGHLAALAVRRIGPELVLSRLWQRLGLDRVLTDLLKGRRYGFAVERMIYFVVLSRLFFPGSDLRSLRIARDYALGVTELRLHHLYRAMAWLGAEYEAVEAALFSGNRDLFSNLSLVFCDTTSLYFEGEGGTTLGRYGYSKDGCPDKHQLIVGAVVDQAGRPIMCPMRPGNTSDVTFLKPVVTRLRDEFGVQGLVAVADRGMVSKQTIAWLEAAKLGYILGVRMRREKDLTIKDFDLGQGFTTIREDLRVKEVERQGRRYVICFNPDEATRDALARAAILASLQKKLGHGAKAVVGNRGYRRYLEIEKQAITVSEARIAADARYDGMYVLRTNTELTPEEVALRYKELWQVERIFREAKSVIKTRPVYHKYDLTIKGHVFASFLALVVMKELMKAVGPGVSWDAIRQDLDALCETEVEYQGARYWLRNPLPGVSGKVLSALGIAAPPSITASKT